MYQCDPELTNWTKLCLRHADVVFMLVDPTDDNKVKDLERDIEALSRRTRKEMIFLHSEDTKYPEGTAEWLKSRNWINAHYHIKCPRRMSSRKTKYTKILNSGPHPDVHSDFSRLSRYITGVIENLFPTFFPISVKVTSSLHFRRRVRWPRFRRGRSSRLLPRRNDQSHAGGRNPH